MFSIGDKIVYPMQGIGVVEKIENKIFCGATKEYIIIKIFSNNLEIMIPTDKIINSNLRMVSDNSTLDAILGNLSLDNNSKDFTSLSSKERYQYNSSKFKSGSLQDNAEVVYDLMLLNKEKALNTSEKQLFNAARKFLVDEVSLIKNMTETEATTYLHLDIN